jgi:hypothetical protein
VKYDRDIRWLRRLLLLLIAVNVGFAIGRFRHGDWINGLAAIIWTVNCVLSMGTIGTSQKTRDQTREVNSAVLKVLLQ